MKQSHCLTLGCGEHLKPCDVAGNLVQSVYLSCILAVWKWTVKMGVERSKLMNPRLVMSVL